MGQQEAAWDEVAGAGAWRAQSSWVNQGEEEGLEEPGEGEPGRSMVSTGRWGGPTGLGRQCFWMGKFNSVKI